MGAARGAPALTARLLSHHSGSGWQPLDFCANGRAGLWNADLPGFHVLIPAVPCQAGRAVPPPVRSGSSLSHPPGWTTAPFPDHNSLMQLFVLPGGSWEGDFCVDKALILIMTNGFSSVQRYSYSWPFCCWSKIIYMSENRFFPHSYSLSTLHICLYFNVLDRIIKYFPNIISLKKATKSLFGQKHFCLWLKGKQNHRMAFYFPCPYSLPCLLSTSSALRVGVEAAVHQSWEVALGQLYKCCRASMLF